MFEKDKTYDEVVLTRGRFIRSGVKIIVLDDAYTQYEFHPSDRGYMLDSIDNKEVNPPVRYEGNRKYFKVREEHIKLLSHLWICWELTSYNYGVPCVDIKRPYGNSGFLSEIIDILGLPYEYDIYLDGYPDEVESKIRQLHHETLIAMQVCIRNGYIKVGEYVADKYNQDWKPVISEELP